MNRYSETLRRWQQALLVVLAAGLFFAGKAWSEEAAAEPEKLFREGVDLFQQGRYAESHAKLRAFMAAAPNKELVAKLVDEAGSRTIAKMMADPRMGAEPTYVWDLYRKYYIGKFNDKERMTRLAAKLVSPDTSLDERATLYREFAELGHYALPILAPYLKDEQHDDFRTIARVAISRMGSRAVLPVLELAGHKDALMRENAILILTDIVPADERAIAVLKTRLEDANESPTVKRLAERALEKITGLKAANLRSAASYYYEQANRYYLERAGVTDEAGQVDGYIWHLNEAGDLVPVLFPLWSWNEQMAEQLALRGASLDPNRSSFYSLLACVYASQYSEVKDLVDLIGETPARHHLSEEEKQEIQEWDKKLIDCRNLAGACGKYNVNDALHKVLADMKRYPAHGRLSGVGVFLAKLLKELDPSGELLGSPEAAPVAVPAAGSPPVLTTIEVTPPVAHVSPNETVQFRAVGKDQYGKVMPEYKNFKWAVEGDGKIDDKGLYQAGPKSGGPYPVTAWVEGGAAPVRGSATTGVDTGPTAAPVNYSAASALVAALECGDMNVEYEAGLALGGINKFPTPWMGSEKVAAKLARGVSENKPLYILLVDEDQNQVNIIRDRLEKLNYGVAEALSGRQGLAQARAHPPKDLILISDKLRRDFTAEQLIEELRADIYTRYTPVAVLHNHAEANLLKARFGADRPLVEREAEGDTLKEMIKKLEESRPAESVPKKKAAELSQRCAEMLASLQPNATLLNLNDAVPACVTALENRADNVRIPSAVFIGHMAGGTVKAESEKHLAEVFLNATNKTELRKAALTALGAVNREKYTDLYLKAQTEKEHELQEEAAYNFGRAARENKSILEFLQTKRVDKDKKEK